MTSPQLKTIENILFHRQTIYNRQILFVQNNLVLPEADCPNICRVGYSGGWGGQREKYPGISNPEGKYYAIRNAKNVKILLLARFRINRVHISGVDVIKDATQKSAHKNEDRWQLVCGWSRHLNPHLADCSSQLRNWCRNLEKIDSGPEIDRAKIVLRRNCENNFIESLLIVPFNIYFLF